MILWTLPEHWHFVESYDGRRIRKDLKYPCPSRSWWIFEAVVWTGKVGKGGNQDIGRDVAQDLAEDARSPYGIYTTCRQSMKKSDKNLYAKAIADSGSLGELY